MTVIRPLTKSGWRDRIASLIRRADAGEFSAMTDLGLDLMEGIQDRKGRSIVRRNPRAAVTWFRRAAKCGDPTAATSLGYAYDVGLGVARDVKQAVRWYQQAARAGDSSAMCNLATVYRDAGKFTQAFKWWGRAAAEKDGNAALDVGYCYQYGIGTTRDPAKAKRMYRIALKSPGISEYMREAAIYSLAVQLIDEGRALAAVPLLQRATVDNDFPEANAVLTQIQRSAVITPCRCRRFIDKTLLGHAKCPVHPERLVKE
jgi:TPR repeat protein